MNCPYNGKYNVGLTILSPCQWTLLIRVNLCSINSKSGERDMNKNNEPLKSGPDCIIPIVKRVPLQGRADALFELVSAGGTKPHQLFFESADIIPFYGKMSIIVFDPCLRVSGRGTAFRLEALDTTGERFLNALEPAISQWATCCREDRRLLSGAIPPLNRDLDEMSRLREVTPFHVLRAILHKLKPATMPEHLFCGLFGAITYDFVDTFESLPPPHEDPQGEDDYFFYYGNNILMADHEGGMLNIICNALVFREEDSVPAFVEATERIEKIGKLLGEEKKSEPEAHRSCAMEVSDEFEKEEFIAIVEQMKKHIVAGDVFQVVPSRTLTVKGIPPPWQIYRVLRRINPSPYMFYLHDGRGVLLGASPEMLLRVSSAGGKRIVQTRPIAGTRPRGLVKGVIDTELDARHEVSLKTDFKELAEHSMLIDLGRNDIAKVSRPGTRIVVNPYSTEKYSHVQHLVTTVQGELRDDLDAFHAYLSAMNAGTLTGAPKLKAMELLRTREKFKRGFYGGAAGYFSINGDMDSCIVIRSMRTIGDCAYLRAGAGIVYDSVPELEFEETGRKLAATVHAIEEAAGRAAR